MSIPPSKGVRRRVLLVDDSKIVGSSASRALRGAGHHVVWVATAAAARAAGGPFDVGVFDVNLNGDSGIDLAVELLDKGAVDRAVFFSATLDAASVARARTLGSFVGKDIAALVREVSR